MEFDVARIRNPHRVQALTWKHALRRSAAEEPAEASEEPGTTEKPEATEKAEPAEKAPEKPDAEKPEKTEAETAAAQEATNKEQQELLKAALAKITVHSSCQPLCCQCVPDPWVSSHGRELLQLPPLAIRPGPCNVWLLHCLRLLAASSC